MRLGAVRDREPALSPNAGRASPPRRSDPLVHASQLRRLRRRLAPAGCRAAVRPAPDLVRRGDGCVHRDAPSRVADQACASRCGYLGRPDHSDPRPTPLSAARRSAGRGRAVRRRAREFRRLARELLRHGVPHRGRAGPRRAREADPVRAREADPVRAVDRPDGAGALDAARPDRLAQAVHDGLGRNRGVWWRLPVAAAPSLRRGAVIESQTRERRRSSSGPRTK